MANHLGAGMQNIVAIFSHTMDMIGDAGIFAIIKRTFFGFQDFLEAILGQLMIFHVIDLMFF